MDPTELMFDPETLPAPPPAAREAELILPNMRGACVTVAGKVHTLFRFTAQAHAGHWRQELGER